MISILDNRFEGFVGEALCYAPHAGEVDIMPLVEILWSRGTRVLLPRCEPERPGRMHLAYATCRLDLAPGRHGILEPKPDECAPVPSCAPALVIVPGVAFDRSGHRIGYGGGYYDRLLATPNLREALLVAPAYDFQILREIPSDPWDRPVDLVVSEYETIEAPS